MAECIEREATIKRIKGVYCVGCNSYNGVRCRACGTGDAIDIIKDAPAADVAPVVHGRWAHLGGDEWCCSAALSSPLRAVGISLLKNTARIAAR